MSANYLPLFDPPAPSTICGMATLQLQTRPVVQPTLRLAHDRPTRDEIQDEILRRTEALRVAGRKSALWWVATGVGKTHTSARYIKLVRDTLGWRTLFLVHRDILVNQAAGEFKDQGINFAVEQADRRAVDIARADSSIECVVGSKDSMQKGRLAQWPTDYFDLIIVDEADLATSTTWAHVLNHFDHKFLVALTATPYRLDGTQLYGPPDSLLGSGAFRQPWPLEGLPRTEKVHECVAFKYTLPQAIKNGHLAEIVAVPAETAIDLRDIRVSKGKGGDFNRGDLDDRISSLVGPLANVTRQHLDRLDIRKAVAFCPDVASSKAYADALTQVGVPAKAVWTGSKKHPLPDTMKQAILNQYRDGRFRVIVSCEVLTAGWDSPETEAVIMLRPTKSRRLFLQAIGRGTRILPTKQKCYVIGFQWEGAEGVMSTLDMFLEDDPKPKLVQAVREHKPKGDFNPLEELEKLKAKVSEDEERERRAMEAARLRVSVKKEDVQHRYREFSVYNAGDILGVAQPVPDRKRAKAAPPTEAQLAILREYGMKRATGLDYDAAQRLVESCMDRGFARLATPEQVTKLVKAGVPIEQARGMSDNEARERLSAAPVKPGLRRWLQHNLGKSLDDIARMTHREACVLFGKWKQGRGIQ